MAQFMFQDMVNKKGLADRFYIDSAATSTEEIGNGPHYGTVGKMREVGIPVLPHRARQMTRADYDAYDLLIGMDENNRGNMVRLLLGRRGWGYGAVSGSDLKKADPDGKIALLLDWSARPRDIADPWYTHDFETTFADVMEGCETLLANLIAR